MRDNPTWETVTAAEARDAAAACRYAASVVHCKAGPPPPWWALRRRARWIGARNSALHLEILAGAWFYRARALDDAQEAP